MRASHQWAADVIGAGHAAGTVPAYASDDWHALPWTDARRHAALVIAAECWWADGLPEVMTERLVDELQWHDHILRERVRRASWDVAAAQDWDAVSRRIPYDELETRRTESMTDALVRWPA